MSFFKWNMYTPSRKSILDTVSEIATDERLCCLAKSYGLNIDTISWEDTGRTKGSCLGPNITDMTLCTEDRSMPIFRKPNFADITADQSITNFTVMVGNENGSDLRQITLTDYLKNIQTYTNNFKIKQLLHERDNTILVSAQACVIPLTNNSVDFCVKMYNYQSNSSSDNPAILVIMASAQGTSAQVVHGNTNLYFNNNGLAFNMKAERLSDDRKKRGVAIDCPMTVEERNRNALIIYQIPLKQKLRVNYPQFYKQEACLSYGDGNALMVHEQCELLDDCSNYNDCSTMSYSKKPRGFEKATISKGRDMGLYTGTKGLELERDDRFPIRCTIQYYNVTDIKNITEDQIQEIARTINNTYITAQTTGSLVLNTTTRQTEPTMYDNYVFTATSKPIIQFL